MPSLLGGLRQSGGSFFLQPLWQALTGMGRNPKLPKNELKLSCWLSLSQSRGISANEAHPTHTRRVLGCLHAHHHQTSTSV